MAKAKRVTKAELEEENAQLNDALDAIEDVLDDDDASASRKVDSIRGQLDQIEGDEDEGDEDDEE